MPEIIVPFGWDLRSSRTPVHVDQVRRALETGPYRNDRKLFAKRAGVSSYSVTRYVNEPTRPMSAKSVGRISTFASTVLHDPITVSYRADPSDAPVVLPDTFTEAVVNGPVDVPSSVVSGIESGEVSNGPETVTVIVRTPRQRRLVEILNHQREVEGDMFAAILNSQQLREDILKELVVSPA